MKRDPLVPARPARMADGHPPPAGDQPFRPGVLEPHPQHAVSDWKQTKRGELLRKGEFQAVVAPSTDMLGNPEFIAKIEDRRKNLLQSWSFPTVEECREWATTQINKRK